MINLWTSFFISNDDNRNDEFKLCLTKNIENEYIDQIILLNETESIVDNPKVINIRVYNRPTYMDYFNYINNLYPDDINIVVNSDIYFDDTIAYINGISHDEMYAISRYEENDDFCGVAFRSQDSWAFKGKIRDMYSNFCLGIWGCDNRIAYEANKVGYKVSNPSFTIKSYHIHKVRKDWVMDDNLTNGPLMFINPTAL